jgi:cell division septation protein DedD
MDQAIPLDQRQQGAGLAMQLREEAQLARATEMTAAELGPSLAGAGPSAVSTVSPPASASRSALDDAILATGMENPAEAGANFALGGADGAASAPGGTDVREAEPVVVASIEAHAPAARPARAQERSVSPGAARESAQAATGPWRVQLGAFSVAGNAEKLWGKLSSRSELKGTERLMVPSGRVTKLQAVGFPTRAAADEACRSLQRSGQDCLVTRS